MFCPECGTEVADIAKSCTKCGRSLVKVKGRSGGGTGVVKVLLIILIVVLVASTGYTVWSQFFPKDESGKDESVQGYSPEGKEWVPMRFDPFGIAMDVPGTGWKLYENAWSQIIFKDTLRGVLDINILSAITLNPDGYRIDNKPQVYNILNQESVFVAGFGEVAYTEAEGNEDGRLVNKHQLYFKRTLTTANNFTQTYTYLVTLTSSSGTSAPYAPIFRHIIDSLELYDYN